jgi:hypothetical protein
VNITKKILSVILSVILAVAVFGICASAEGTASGDESMTVTVTTDQDTYAPGDNITVSVSIKTNYNMTAFRFPIMFDSDVFELPNLINLTALNTCKAKGTLMANSQYDGSSLPDGYYDMDSFQGILVQWTASVSNSTLGCLNLPDGEVCFTFTVKAKSSAAGKTGTFFVPAEYTGFYNQAVETPTDATTIYYIDSESFAMDFISKTVNVVGETADLVLNTAYDSNAVIDKTNMVVYGFDVGMSTTAELKQKVVASGAGSLKVEFTEYGLGTGSKINVVDDTIVKTYSVVIFGDVNGDALIDSNDFSDISSVSVSLKDYTDDCLIFAADVNGDSVVDVIDAGIVFSVAVSLSDLDQTNPY